MALRGTFTETEPADVLQILALGGKTGILTVTAQHHTAKLMFKGGRLIDAFDGIQRGEDAVFVVLAARTGSFVFTPQNVPSETTIDRDISAILLGAARQLDDLTRARELLQQPTARPYRLETASPDASGGFGEAERLMLDLVDGQRTLGDIVAAAEIGPELAYRALGSLVERGLVAFVTADDEESPLTDDSQSVSVPGPPETSGAEVDCRPARPEELREIAEHLRCAARRPAEGSARL